MFTTGNAIYNNKLAALSKQAAPPVIQAIETASRRTGVDFAYLVQQAAAESSFNPKAEAKTSSATGLYQFIESTWLQMVKRYGDRYGLGHYADKIDDRGRVGNKALRNEILALRKNPQTAAFLAAEFANENALYLERNLDKSYGEVGATELYLAHFLGAGGATAFLNAYKDNPMATAADLFPQAARANRNVFYDPANGKPRTLAGVYDFFDKKFDAGEGRPVNAHGLTASNASARPISRRNAIAEGISQEMQGHRIALNTLDSRSREVRADYQPRRKPVPAVTPGLGLVRHPAEIMLMARLEAPQRAEERTVNRYAHNRQNRYN